MAIVYGKSGKDEHDWLKPRLQYRCAYCTEIYLANCDLRRHVKRVHPGKEPPSPLRRPKRQTTNHAETKQENLSLKGTIRIVQLPTLIIKTEDSTERGIRGKDDLNWLKPHVQYRCLYCTEVYLANWDLRRHVKRVHPGKEPPPPLRRPKRKTTSHAEANQENLNLKGTTKSVQLPTFIIKAEDSTEREQSAVLMKKDEADWLKPHVQYRCAYCTEIYLANWDLRKHVKRAHPGQEPPPPLRRNRRQTTNHAEESMETAVEREMQRGKRVKGISWITKSFLSFQEFKTWKECEEDLTKTRFVKDHGDKKMSKYTLCRFKCHRSGNHHPSNDRRRRLKIKGSCKIGMICPALMVLKIFAAGNCILSYCNEHKGHAFELKHLPLRKTQREEIASLLASGIPFRDVLQKFAKTAQPEHEYKLLATRQNLFNILKEFKIERSSQPTLQWSIPGVPSCIDTGDDEHVKINAGMQLLPRVKVQVEIEQIKSNWSIVQQYLTVDNPDAVAAVHHDIERLASVLTAKYRHFDYPTLLTPSLDGNNKN